MAPCRHYRGPQAIEEAFKAMPAPRVLHLATHGFFLPENKTEEESDDSPGTGAAAGLARLSKVSNPTPAFRHRPRWRQPPR